MNLISKVDPLELERGGRYDTTDADGDGKHDVKRLDRMGAIDFVDNSDERAYVMYDGEEGWIVDFQP